MNPVLSLTQLDQRDLLALMSATIAAGIEANPSFSPSIQDSAKDGFEKAQKIISLINQALPQGLL